jgi:hypothetical protein
MVERALTVVLSAGFIKLHIPVYSMNPIHVRFIINQLTEAEVDALKNGDSIITKMILSPDDFRLFHYREGDSIEVQTDHGNRLWCNINHLEVVSDDIRVIIIFTLMRDNKAGL